MYWGMDISLFIWFLIGKAGNFRWKINNTKLQTHVDRYIQIFTSNTVLLLLLFFLLLLILLLLLFYYYLLLYSIYIVNPALTMKQRLKLPCEIICITVENVCKKECYCYQVDFKSAYRYLPKVEAPDYLIYSQKTVYVIYPSWYRIIALALSYIFVRRFFKKTALMLVN